MIAALRLKDENSGAREQTWLEPKSAALMFSRIMPCTAGLMPRIWPGFPASAAGSAASEASSTPSASVEERPSIDPSTSRLDVESTAKTSSAL